MRRYGQLSKTVRFVISLLCWERSNTRSRWPFVNTSGSGSPITSHTGSKGLYNNIWRTLYTIPRNQGWLYCMFTSATHKVLYRHRPGLPSMHILCTVDPLASYSHLPVVREAPNPVYMATGFNLPTCDRTGSGRHTPTGSLQAIAITVIM